MIRSLPLLLILILGGCAAEDRSVDIVPGISIGAGDYLPHLKYRGTPRYPTETKNAGVKGEVTTEFTIAKNGAVSSAKSEATSAPKLSESVEAASLIRTFAPGLENGVPAVCRMQCRRISAERKNEPTQRPQRTREIYGQFFKFASGVRVDSNVRQKMKSNALAGGEAYVCDGVISDWIASEGRW